MSQETGRTAGGACAAAVPLSPAPLLIVEDDDTIAAVITEILSDAGYIVTRATSPRATLALFATQGPGAYRLVLSDAFTRDRAQAYTWYERLRTVTTAPIAMWSAASPAFYDDYRAPTAMPAFCPSRSISTTSSS